MKKHSNESLKVTAFEPQPLNIPAKPHVRYVGFEGIEGGRRLRFSVKSIAHESVEISIEISDTAFTGASEISIQDAAPMAFEKIVELLTTKDALESNELCLTDADIAQYITRHESSQKRRYSRSDGIRRSDAA
jgi:hypothetical protein